MSTNKFVSELKKCKVMFKHYVEGYQYITPCVHKNCDEYEKIYKLITKRNKLKYKLNKQNNMDTTENRSKLCTLDLNNFISNKFYKNTNYSNEYFKMNKRKVTDEIKELKHRII